MTPQDLYEEATDLHRGIADIAYGYTAGYTDAQREHAACLIGKSWRRTWRRADAFRLSRRFVRRLLAQDAK